MDPRIIPLHHRTLSRVFELDGWKFVRQKGDHLEYQKEGASRPVVIPRYKEIPVFIIRKNMRTAGMSRERFFELLEKAE